ncbi:hypothetical protein GCM10011371_26940 [Novosphingobium marinum]|uniref:Cell wall-associated NlpC family hydrolase n=1 Tax=Novosphingobium marinum TaxID=1514948 RepID=A0A7Y9XUH0_9SPHN|nr:NlpC/P60 family protein [Novosphingobium marinum]NYH94690.1 cell wall-associated NlpC family hydrolase [Novosphingobium marinum]GGC38148.1 hypothetical protein GCM10011371_26940 [Novosphingobium marinum]
MSGNALAAAAGSFAGVPFRLHGRRAEHGLDCIGLLHASLVAIGKRPRLPNGYRLRALSRPDLDEVATACGLARVEDEILPGDVLLVEPGPCQLHLMICLNAQSFVHAHAGARRVLIQSGGLPWPTIRQLRLSEEGH